MENIILSPIGYVKNNIEIKKDDSWGKDTSVITLNDEYKGGLLGLNEFSHCIILFYLNKTRYDSQKHLQRRPRNIADMPLTGIFAQRGKDRPNQIGMTSVKIVSVSEKELTVQGLDAIDGTPVIDIKPVFKEFLPREKIIQPEWTSRLMEKYWG